MTAETKEPNNTEAFEMRVAAVFREALDITNADITDADITDADITDAARAKFVEHACGSDAQLLASVLGLLQAAAVALPILDAPIQLTPEQHNAVLRFAAPTPRAGGMRVGVFSLIKPIGAGGMGEVWLAERRDAAYTQRVAIKWLDSRLLGTSGLVRFALEREILGRLDHPGIARIVDGGDQADESWFAMDYIDGLNFTQFVSARHLDLAASVALLLPLCDAVQYLHQNLIVHRDLKPSNVLVDASGRPRLLDFGVAKVLNNALQGGDTLGDTLGATQTATRAPITIAYAAPEQIEGRSITTACDVYALGVMLFELLSGVRPHAQAEVSLGQLAKTITERDAAAPSRALAANPSARPWSAGALRGDLDTIVLRCLQRDSTRRYASVQALHDDLARYLQHLPISARPDRFGYRLGKHLRRHPIGTALSAAALSALLGLGIYSTLQAQRAQASAHLAQISEAKALRERDVARAQAKRQEALREHFVAVINRATASAGPISPEALMQLTLDSTLSSNSGDLAGQRALKLAMAEVLLVRADFPRLLELVDSMTPLMQGASEQERAELEIHRANASLRLSKALMLQTALTAAAQAIQRGGLGHSLLAADLWTLRGQSARGLGDSKAAMAYAKTAADIARAAVDANALPRGVTLANYGVALFASGDIQAALAAIDEARTIWQLGGVSNNSNAATTSAIRASAQMTLGYPKAALQAYDELSAAAPAGESAMQRASRSMSRARALALLGRGPEAVLDSGNARNTICAASGANSTDCAFLRVAEIDVLLIHGAYADASAAVRALQTSVASLPPQLAQILTLDAQIAAQLPELALGRGDVKLLRWALQEAAQSSKMAQRSSVRWGFVAAEQLRGAGQLQSAAALASDAINGATDLALQGGMDATLARIWDKERNGVAAATGDVAALVALLGAEHRFVQGR